MQRVATAPVSSLLLPSHVGKVSTSILNRTSIPRRIPTKGRGAEMTTSDSNSDSPPPVLDVQPGTVSQDGHFDERLRVDVNDNASSSKTSMDLLTPPPEDDQMSDKPSPSNSAEESVKEKKSKKANGLKKSSPDDAVRKSNRITRNCDAATKDVVDNYVDVKDLKQPRSIVTPKGGVRHPFRYPKVDGEKEKDRLRIHMVGPKTRSKPDEFVIGLSMTKREPFTVPQGPDFQADYPYYYEDSFVQPSNSSRTDIQDRDELLWVPHSGICDKDLEDAWEVIRSQYAGTIGIDAMLHCLMRSNYDVDEMLQRIEMEQWENLPHPFEGLNVAQQKEFGRLLRKQGSQGKHKEGEKIFRLMQEKFLRTYHLGEISKYYYDTKRRGCFHEQYNRCECRENLTSSVLPLVPRYECANCTTYLREGKSGPQKFCAVCELYYKRNGVHRIVVGPLFEKDEKIVRRWVELEKREGRKIDSQEVIESLEIERRKSVLAKPNYDEIPVHTTNRRVAKLDADGIITLTKKFEPIANPRCSIIHPWGHELRQIFFKGFNKKETLAIIKSFQKLGMKFDAIAAEIGCSERDITYFYKRHRFQYQLDTLVNPVKKAIFEPPPPADSPSMGQLTRSASLTPEPIPRRKRAGSDPAYCERNEAPPTKSTRRTRQSAATLLESN